MSEKIWELLPFFILRSTGFAYNQLERLAFRHTSTALDALLDCEEKLAQCRTRLQDALAADHTSETYKLRRTYWDKIKRNRAFTPDKQARELFAPAIWEMLQQWLALLAQCHKLKEESQTIFTEELVDKRRVLRDLVADEIFQEAVWLSSPQMYRNGLQRYLKNWQAHKRPSRTRRIERQLVSYLQRFCAKNDTAGFFGPVNYGDFVTPPDDAPLAGPGHERVQHRQAFMAYWAIKAIATCLADDPQVAPYLQPYRAAYCQIDEANGQINIGHKVCLKLTTAVLRVLQQVDGIKNVSQIATALGLTHAKTLNVLQKLVKARAITLIPTIPITTLTPLAWLCNWVDQLPTACSTRTDWVKTLAKFKQLQDCFATAPFAEKPDLLAEMEALLTTITKQAARRGGGEFYADRLMIYEESLGGMSPLFLGSDFAAELQAQLAPVLDLCAAHACDIQGQKQAFGAAVVSEMTPDTTIPLLRLAATLHQQNVTFEPLPSPWQKAIMAQVAAQGDAKEVQLDLASLPPTDQTLLATRPLLTSPDVMLLAQDEAALRSGDFQVILAECHDTFMVWGWALAFHPQQERVLAEASRLLEQVRGDRVIANVLTSKRAKIVPFEYPGPTIEMKVPSEKPPSDRIPVSEVMVKVGNGRLQLNAPEWDDLILYNGELPTLAHSLFALPRVVPPRLMCAEHTPRITVGKVVLQRERWQVQREQLFPNRYQGASWDLMADFRRAARDLKLPRYMFAIVQNEPKPVFVDSDNYFLLEMLHYLIPEGEQVILSEMLPAPDQLWLRHQDDVFCAELRLSTCYVSPKTTG